MTSRRNPGAAFWATVVVAVVLVAYPLSLGPAWRCWMNMGKPESLGVALNWLYAPLWTAADHGPDFIWNALYEYETWGAFACDW
jgi:hypothetical protein